MSNSAGLFFSVLRYSYHVVVYPGTLNHFTSFFEITADDFCGCNVKYFLVRPHFLKKLYCIVLFCIFTTDTDKVFFKYILPF